MQDNDKIPLYKIITRKISSKMVLNTLYFDAILIFQRGVKNLTDLEKIVQILLCFLAENMTKTQKL